jgi:hypothetical protein
VTNYDIDTWLNVAMGCNFVRKDSYNDLLDFNPSQFMISLGVSL